MNIYAGSANPELVARIRELAWSGLTDKDIGARLGYQRTWIGEIRRANNITPGRYRQVVEVAKKPLTPAEQDRLTALAARQYQGVPRTGICGHCEVIVPLDPAGLVSVHPRVGTTWLQRRPCRGSWHKPLTD